MAKFPFVTDSITGDVQIITNEDGTITKRLAIDANGILSAEIASKSL